MGVDWIPVSPLACFLPLVYWT